MKSRIIALLSIGLLLIICITAPSASAYIVVGDSDNEVVRLHFDRSEAYILALYPSYAAGSVVIEADIRRIEIQRTKNSIATEIRAHAILMLSPNVKIYRNGQWRYTHEIANPMDIEMYQEEAWVYILD